MEPGAHVPHAIFISYRRKESLVETRAVYERLRAEFGPESVFIDLEGLEYGLDFVEVLNQQLANCRVMLALMGPDWAGSNALMGRRLDDENDFVRIELRTALARSIRVVPVLINGASMPRSDELPADIRSLVRRHALELDFRRFDGDIGRLVFALRKIMNTAETTKVPPVVSDDATGGTKTSAATPSVNPPVASSPPSAPAIATSPAVSPTAHAIVVHTESFVPAPEPLSTERQQSSTSMLQSAANPWPMPRNLFWLLILGASVALIVLAFRAQTSVSPQSPATAQQAVAENSVGTVDRCKGSYEQAKCEEMERKLLAETPQERLTRQASLEAARRANMRSVR